MSEDLISSLYPPPPPFYKFFSDENVARTKELGDDEEPTGELKFLRPPKAPEESHYRNYGSLWAFEDKLPQLDDMGWKQLYKESDDELENSKQKIAELHKLLNALLLNFLELVGIMSVNPSEFHTKIEALKLILININHILNSYRPVQSRESLIMLLRKRIDSTKSEINQIDTKMKEIKEHLLALTNYDLKKTEEDEETETKPTIDLKNEIVKKLLTESV